MYPVRLWDGETQWKIEVFYIDDKDEFYLRVNDIPFPHLPYKAEVTQGAQNIEGGLIKLNKVRVHRGFAQYTADTIDEWVAE